MHLDQPPRKPRESRPLRAVATMLAGTAVLALAGCERRGELEVVHRRLGPTDFGQPERAHAPVVQIGNEAREVIAAPQMHLLGHRRAVTAEPGQGIRVDLQLFPNPGPPRADGAHLVSVRITPRGDAAAEVVAQPHLAHYRTLSSGWRLERDADRVTVELAPETTHEMSLFDVRVQTIDATPATLTSTPFTLGRQPHLEIGYGLANEGLGSGAPVEFSANLECPGFPARLLLDDTISPGGTGSPWRDATIALPAERDDCRLALETRGADRDLAAPVWATPRILIRAAPLRPDEPQGLIVISLDTLRADHLSGYGYPRATSPSIDRELIARGTSFSSVITPYPLTNMAHMSVFTGLYPEAIPEPPVLTTDASVVFLAEALRDAGFETGAFTEDGLVAGALGFWLGFDRLVERAFSTTGRGVATFEDGARFLRENRRRRFFLFLHTYKVHSPYVSSPRYESLFRPAENGDGSHAVPDRPVPAQQRPAVDAYDRAIREADDQVAELLRELDRLDLTRRTLIVLLSDHGEAFGEHGLTGHGQGGHQEQLRVPLILRGPGIPAGRVVDTPASLIDVLPTTLDLLGVERPPTQGVSLAKLLAGSAPPAERPLSFSWIGLDARGVVIGERKYVEQNGRGALYDLARDPHEQRPIEQEQDFAEARRVLGERVAESAQQKERRSRAPAHAASAPAVSEEVQRSLRALGYLDSPAETES